MRMMNNWHRAYESLRPSNAHVSLLISPLQLNFFLGSPASKVRAISDAGSLPAFGNPVNGMNYVHCSLC